MSNTLVNRDVCSFLLCKMRSSTCTFLPIEHSLDRTNVVQSTFAKWALTQQLKQANVLGDNESLDAFPDFMFLFRNGQSQLASSQE